MSNNLTDRQTGYPSIDKPWLTYYSEEAINSTPPNCTIYRNIVDNNKNHLNDVAILYFGKKITYLKLFKEVEKTAAAFIAYGIKEDDNVSICMPAVPEILFSILALNKIGANAALLNPTFTEQQLIDRIAESQSTLLITINELYDKLKKVVPKTSVNQVVCLPAVNSLGPVVKFLKKTKKIQGTVSWDDFLKSGKGIDVVEAKYLPDRSAIMVFSSGSTGASKGIQLRNSGINWSINDGAQIGFEWKRQEKWIAPIPVWFSTGIVASVLVPLCHGITVILEPQYDFNIFKKHIHKYHPNYIITAAAPVGYLLTKKSDDFKYFKYFVVGGEYVTPSADKRFSNILLDSGAPYGLFKGYGMCECGGTVTASNIKCNVLGSAGIPLPHVTIAAFDLETGKELKYGERGEIRVNTPCRMKGYFKKAQETEQYFHTDEQGNVWCCTGDMGYVTEDGSVYISGRLNDSYINENKETIYLFDIERTALDVAGVKQCKAVASVIKGKKTHVCHIVFDDVEKEKTIKLIQEYSLKNLPYSHVPHLFKVYEESLPVAPNGKLNILKMEKSIDQIIELE